jgi:uncharacterized protein
METAIAVLRAKGHHISDEEAEAASVAILLHDIGHGPFSHSLEFSVAQGVSHEKISKCFMVELNRQFNHRLQLAIEIFSDTYQKRFLHQLVSGQLDMDRMDYLCRDSFFTGVTEGTIGSERIIKMLNIVNDQLVVEAKGIYSIEKFLIARRLMYWQVYLHKAVLAAEQLLIKMLSRARELIVLGVNLECSPSLLYFLKREVTIHDFENCPSKDTQNALYNFSNLDDTDIMSAAKQWMAHSDPILSALAKMLVYRRLLKVEMRNARYSEKEVLAKSQEFEEKHPSMEGYGKFFVSTGSVSNNAYRLSDESIKILYNDGTLEDVVQVSDMLNAQSLLQDITKFFICYPKEAAIY